MRPPIEATKDDPVEKPLSSDSENEQPTQPSTQELISKVTSFLNSSGFTLAAYGNLYSENHFSDHRLVIAAGYCHEVWDKYLEMKESMEEHVMAFSFHDYVM